VNYVPNLDVLKVIKSNPFIIDQAKWSLAEDLRKELEKRLEALEDEDNIRVGADAPSGSGVIKRKSEQGAAAAEAAQVDNSQSVNGIIDQSNQAPVDSSADQSSAGGMNTEATSEDSLLEGE
jgi:hypothetical protein